MFPPYGVRYKAAIVTPCDSVGLSGHFYCHSVPEGEEAGLIIAQVLTTGWILVIDMVIIKPK
jgi:hypothetical protein